MHCTSDFPYLKVNIVGKSSRKDQNIILKKFNVLAYKIISYVFAYTPVERSEGIETSSFKDVVEILHSLLESASMPNEIIRKD